MLENFSFVSMKHVEECLQDYCTQYELIKASHRTTQQEGLIISKFLQESLNAAFSKCLDDSALLSWNHATQRDILRACVAFIELAAEKLKVSSMSRVTLPPGGVSANPQEDGTSQTNCS